MHQIMMTKKRNGINEFAFVSAETPDDCLDLIQEMEQQEWLILSVIYGHVLWKWDCSGIFISDAVKRSDKAQTSRILGSRPIY